VLNLFLITCELLQTCHVHISFSIQTESVFIIVALCVCVCVCHWESINLQWKGYLIVSVERERYVPSFLTITRPSSNACTNDNCASGLACIRFLLVDRCYCIVWYNFWHDWNTCILFSAIFVGVIISEIFFSFVVIRMWLEINLAHVFCIYYFLMN